MPQDDNGWEKAEEAHEKYRGVGLALMTTIIGLSTGAIYGLGPESSKVKPWFFLPIAICLLQQLAHYLGSQYQARSLYHWSRWLVMLEQNQAKAGSVSPDDQIKELDARFANLGNANRYYGWADRGCVVAVLVFVFVGFAFCFSHSELTGKIDAPVTPASSSPMENRAPDNGARSHS